MTKTQLVRLLCELNNENITGNENDKEIFLRKCEKTRESLSYNSDEILKRLTSLVNHYEGDTSSYEWQYVCLNFYILEILNDELIKSDLEVLSVQEIKNVKAALGNLMFNGILQKLQPNLPHAVKNENNKSDVINTYNVLKCTTLGFITALKHSDLRMLILPHLLQGILVASIQIAFCPLKKPNSCTTNDKFFMSEATYIKFLKDQELFKEILEDLRHNIHPAFFARETMNLFQSNSPLWFKKAISNILTKFLRSKNGVEHIASAMLDDSDDDTTKTWKVLDVLTKLIISCRKFSDFQQNICAQVLQLLDIVKDRGLFVFERLVVSCTKALYLEDKELCKEVFLRRLSTPLSYFVDKKHVFPEDHDVTDDIKQSVRLIHGCFLDDAAKVPCLPMDLLKFFVNVLFTFYHLSVKSSLQTMNKELKELLIKYLQCCSDDEIDHLLNSFLFGFDISDIPRIRDDIIIEINEKITIKRSEHTILYATADAANSVFDLLDTNQKVILFGFLLKCITEKEMYFPSSTNKELLSVEDQSTANTVLERLLTIHKLLSQLAENKQVQRSLRDRPEKIIKYINNVLISNRENSDFVFIIVMILDNLIVNASVDGLVKYRILIEPLSKIAVDSSNEELKNICNKILIILREKKVNVDDSLGKELTEFEKALEDICDPLLPVRGHGLLVLTKLIEKKDKQAMDRKQYLLNLFQLSLKNEDSFIYLNAVQGLAALADVFPDTVLEVLCDEYADFTKKNGEEAQETRMKLGEVLVRVVKLLGDMAPKYKALLLNTFLSGTRDDDHLIRASSLSNLGEVCRVLNYKLGTIVTEVLVCVHAIITTDKAVEARRAAVTVIRQLFVGLQSEMISFLREEILPIYRTLKEIYYHDKDDVMRLQAQLALEELNENMKSFVFPNPELNFEKKVITLD